MISDNFGLNPFNSLEPLKPSPPPDPKTIDKIKHNLASLTDGIHRWGITFTALLPFSSRGIIANVLLFPIRLVQSIGPGFYQKMKNHIQHDWHRGIQDSYVDLTTPEAGNLKKTVIEDNLSYAAYMYKGSTEGRRFHFGEIINKEDQHGILLPNIYGKEMPLDENYPVFNQIVEKLEDMGFKRLLLN